MASSCLLGLGLGQETLGGDHLRELEREALDEERAGQDIV